MELVGIMRLLLAHRKLLVVGVVLAVLVSVAANRRVGPTTSSGTAVERVLIGPADAVATNRATMPTETLVMRTKLLADLMSADRVRERITADAHIRPGQLAVKGPATMLPLEQVPLAVRATQAAAATGKPYVLTVEAADLTPIMTLTAGAPTAAQASDVVATATANLRRLVAEGASARGGIAVEPLGPVLARTVVQQPSRVKAMAASIVLLILWCSGIVIVAGIRRRPRPGSPQGAVAFLP